MFGEKKQVNEFVCPDPFKDKIKCDECKHWIDKKDASNVYTYGISGRVDYWYCPMHKKPYTHYIQAYPDNIYYGEVSMSKDGTPIGYKKIKSN